MIDVCLLALPDQIKETEKLEEKAQTKGSEVQTAFLFTSVFVWAKSFDRGQHPSAATEELICFAGGLDRGGEGQDPAARAGLSA